MFDSKKLPYLIILILFADLSFVEFFLFSLHEAVQLLVEIIIMAPCIAYLLLICSGNIKFKEKKDV